MEQAHATAAAPTSLEPLETNVSFSRIGTASQLKLHRGWWGLRDKIITAFEESDDPTLQKRAARLDGCCANPLVHGAPNGEAKLVLQCCRDRLCPLCQKRRGGEAARRISTLVRGWNSCRFATLTLMHRGSPLAEELDRLSEAFRSLRKEPDWKSRVKEGVWSIEVTLNPATRRWHCHLHLLYSGQFFPQKLLSSLWLAITKDSPIVDVRAVPDREKTAHYIAAYVSKPADAERWSSGEIREYAAAMHGRRLIHTFGRAHGSHVDKADSAEAMAPSEFVAPLRPLIAAAGSGDPEARHAIEILCRISPVYAKAAGENPRPQHAVTAPVELWEHAKVIRETKRCFDDLMDRMNGVAPVAERLEPRRSAEQLLVFDTPSYR